MLVAKGDEYESNHRRTQRKKCVGLRRRCGEGSLYDADLTGPVAVVVGNEGRASPKRRKEHVDALPFHSHAGGNSESLKRVGGGLDFSL